MSTLRHPVIDLRAETPMDSTRPQRKSHSAFAIGLGGALLSLGYYLR